MKKNILLSLIALAMTGCASSDLEMPNETNNLVYNSHFVSETKAKEQVINFLGKTRSQSSDFSVSKIYSNDLTRSSITPVAYVFNDKSNGGWVLVATDDRSYPILGYSDNGSFEINDVNHPVNNVLINNLGYYYDSLENDSIYPPNDGLVACYEGTPLLTWKIGQNYPWNKYVVENYQNGTYVAGCVPVATASIMLQGKPSLYYHNEFFDFERYRESYEFYEINEYEPNTDDAYISEHFPNIYTYSQITDKLAKLLYWIGLDIDAEYYYHATYASTLNALALLYNNGYDIELNTGNASPLPPEINPNNPTTECIAPYNYNDMAMTQLLTTGQYVIMIEGSDLTNLNAGHCWIIDAVRFCRRDPFSLSNDDIENIMFHCCWGWGGLDDGYYYSRAFNVINAQFNAFLRYRQVRVIHDGNVGGGGGSLAPN